jgi:hypothetical protein
MYRNPDHAAKPAAGVADARTALQKLEWVYTKPSEKKPSAYLEPALLGASFFTHVDVEVNNFPVGEAGPSMGIHGWFYAVFNKVFCSDKLRLEKYDKEIPRISTEFDRSATNDAADLKTCSKSLEFDTAETSGPLMCDFGFDG